MDIQNNNVSIQINAKDLSGRQLRVADCAVFIVHVYTDDMKQYLTFSKRDMLMTEFVDELVVPRHQMENLRSGVVQYSYSYLPANHDCIYDKDDEANEEVVENEHTHKHHHFAHQHEQLIHSKPVVTSIYWRNIKHPHPSVPVNSVSYFDIKHLHDLIEKEHVDREVAFNQLQSIFTDDFDAKLDAEIERSTAEDEKINAELESIKAQFDELNTKSEETGDKVNQEIADNSAAITAEVNRATQKEIELEQLIQGEVSRAKSAEEVIDTKISMEKERAQANEANINDRLVSVTDRFDAFKSITNEAINKLNADLSAETSRSAQKDIEHSNLVETEANRAKAVENKLTVDLDTEIARAKDAEKHLLDEVHNVSDKVSKLAEVDNIYNKAEVDTMLTDVNNTLSTVSTKLDITDGKADAEIVRAKSVESELSDEIKNLKSAASDKNTETADAITALAADLIKEVARAKAAEKVNADAITILTGDSATPGSVKKSLSDAKEYTDIELAKLSVAKNAELADALKNYTTVSDVDKKISEVIGTAPEALDTLGKISTALSADSDAISAINGVLAGKANSADIYTKSELNTKFTEVKNDVSKLETKVVNADSAINNRIDDLVTKVNAVESAGNTQISSLADAIAGEETARKAAVKTVADKLDSEVDKLNTKVSEVNSALIEDIAKSDAKDIELEAKIDANTATIASEIARAKQVETELNQKINDIDISGQLIDYVKRSEVNTYVDNAVANTPQFTVLQSNLTAEVNRAKAAENEIYAAIDNVSDTLADAIDELNNIFNSSTGGGSGSGSGSSAFVTGAELADALDDYYTKDEITSVLASESAQYATKTSVNAKADKTSVYTKTEADARFLQAVTMTAEQYEALATKNNNMLYIII